MKRIIVSAVACVLGVRGAPATAAPPDATAAPVATAAPTAPRLRVAVVPGIAVNLDASRVDALGQDLASALSAQLDVDAIGGLDVRRALPAELPADCVTIPACVTDVAQRTGAQQLLFVVMVDSGANGSIQIDTTWIDVATGRSVQRPAIDILVVAEARAKFDAVARQLLPDAPLRVTHVTAPQPPPIAPPPPAEGLHVTAVTTALGIVGVAGLGLGLGFGLSTRSTYNSCDAKPATCSTSTRSSIRTTGVIADASWITGVVALAAGAVMYLRSSDQAVVVTPTDGGGAAATLVGRF